MMDIGSSDSAFYETHEELANQTMNLVIDNA